MSLSANEPERNNDEPERNDGAFMVKQTITIYLKSGASVDVKACGEAYHLQNDFVRHMNNEPGAPICFSGLFYSENSGAPNLETQKTQVLFSEIAAIVYKERK